MRKYLYLFIHIHIYIYDGVYRYIYINRDLYRWKCGMAVYRYDKHRAACWLAVCFNIFISYNGNSFSNGKIISRTANFRINKSFAFWRTTRIGVFYVIRIKCVWEFFCIARFLSDVNHVNGRIL